MLSSAVTNPDGIRKSSTAMLKSSIAGPAVITPPTSGLVWEKPLRDARNSIERNSAKVIFLIIALANIFS
jgi:hypothetical protein